MQTQQPLNDAEEISRRVLERVDQEQAEFRKHKLEGHSVFPSARILKALKANENRAAGLNRQAHSWEAKKRRVKRWKSD